MDKHTQQVMFSSKSDEYGSPWWLFNMLDDIMHFSLDPAASDLLHMCQKYYTPEDNGLEQLWNNETWYINPPYSDVKDWSARASIEFLSGYSEGVMLIPARTETKYWHDNIWPTAHYLLFLEGRLKFTKTTDEELVSAPFPSVVIFYTYRTFGITEATTLSEHGALVDLWKSGH